MLHNGRPSYSGDQHGRTARVWGQLGSAKTSSPHVNNRGGLFESKDQISICPGWWPSWKIHQTYPLQRFCPWLLSNIVVVFAFRVLFHLILHNLCRRFPRNRNDMLLASNCLECTALLHSICRVLPGCILPIVPLFRFYFENGQDFHMWTDLLYDIPEDSKVSYLLNLLSTSFLIICKMVSPSLS